MDKYRITQQLSLSGLFLNLLLAVGKIAIGGLSRSQSMLADGLNSAGDVLASFLTWMGNRIASEPEDKEHPFGHGKAEYVFSLLIGISMLIAAVSMSFSAVRSIREGSVPDMSVWLFVMILVTLIVKSVLFVVTRKAANQYDSLLLQANAEDHRNDIFVSLGTLAGLAGALLAIPWLDGVVGLTISIWLGYAGVRIFYAAYRVLMDTTAGNAVIKEWEALVLTIEGVDHIDSIVAQPVGARFLLVVKISVNAALTVKDAHDIAGAVRAELRKRADVADAVVHLNPT